MIANHMFKACPESERGQKCWLAPSGNRWVCEAHGSVLHVDGSWSEGTAPGERTEPGCSDGGCVLRDNNAPRFVAASKVRAALGNGPITDGRKLIVAVGLGRELGLDRIVAEPVHPGRSDMPDEVELWLWLAWEMCDHVEWGASS